MLEILKLAGNCTKHKERVRGNSVVCLRIISLVRETEENFAKLLFVQSSFEFSCKYANNFPFFCVFGRTDWSYMQIISHSSVLLEEQIGLLHKFLLDIYSLNPSPPLKCNAKHQCIYFLKLEHY